MSKNIELRNTQVNVYDEVPYESYPYQMSHPYHLMTLGVLFGLQAPSPQKARILELGCAAGGNILPHAINYPESEFVGVDLSAVQIGEARKHVEALGLKNIKFHQCSISDVDNSFGNFDYIICHGVLSWVPEGVRRKILEIVGNNLTPNGIAYISYNTLPGWNMIRTIRDMMLYHSNRFTDVREKIAQARLLLEFVKDSLEGANTPYAEVLKTEAALLAKQSDHYLRHDHLEEDNKQYYFYEFMEEAKGYNLQYLSDTHLSTMYLGNMPPKVAQKLQEINDIVRTEQYMDFITNRRFRSTLLCRNTVVLNRSINNEDILKFNLNFNIVPEKPLNEIDINDSLEVAKFFYNNSKESNVSTSSPIMKAIIYTFSENVSNYVSFDKIAVAANKKLGGNKLAEVKREFLTNAMKLVLQGYINISLQNNQSRANLEKPKVWHFASYQSANNGASMWVTNTLHSAIGINLFEKIAIKYMDGKHNTTQIIDNVMEHVNKGELNISRDGKKIEDGDEIKKELNNLLDSTITKFAANSLLVE